MEVGVAIGPDPTITFSAIAPLPPDVDEILFAGFLRSKPVEMMPCRTVDVEAPATAEIVLEGYVDLGERRTAGPGALLFDDVGGAAADGGLPHGPRHRAHLPAADAAPVARDCGRSHAV